MNLFSKRSKIVRDSYTSSASLSFSFLIAHSSHLINQDDKKNSLLLCSSGPIVFLYPRFGRRRFNFDIERFPLGLLQLDSGLCGDRSDNHFDPSEIPRPKRVKEGKPGESFRQLPYRLRLDNMSSAHTKPNQIRIIYRST